MGQRLFFYSIISFLMHRVELKALSREGHKTSTRVPNAPCGVESVMSEACLSTTLCVPNAPCGVER